ncbi:PREDICTED: uncharacterized protein LOC109589283 [Amphimedon queenslandica]|uniref:Uncharacterized protein n=1 Tax=Amphimedon queenslandica TaxID=400682 RepID=A0A1X7VW09_AMPQE|nr:PREDICTED: uncharacterized protein LOC109589283 [Amphimedon queenslandica]|eukprot:XP_019860970.1 PREDICTED: uncharacterized protein LOC109589283 [Amphimedon queenslandica]
MSETIDIYAKTETTKIEQQVQQNCTQEPVVTPALKGWIDAKVIQPVSVVQEKVDEIKKTGDIDGLSKVQIELNKVKEECQRLNERSETHKEELKRQHEADHAHFIVEIALRGARSEFQINEVLKRLDVLESEKEREERVIKRKNPVPITNRPISKNDYNDRSRLDSGVSLNSVNSVNI